MREAIRGNHESPSSYRIVAPYNGTYCRTTDTASVLNQQHGGDPFVAHLRRGFCFTETERMNSLPPPVAGRGVLA